MSSPHASSLAGVASTSAKALPVLVGSSVDPVTSSFYLDPVAQEVGRPGRRLGRGGAVLGATAMRLLRAPVGACAKHTWLSAAVCGSLIDVAVVRGAIAWVPRAGRTAAPMQEETDSDKVELGGPLQSGGPRGGWARWALGAGAGVLLGLLVQPMRRRRGRRPPGRGTEARAAPAEARIAPPAARVTPPEARVAPLEAADALSPRSPPAPVEAVTALSPRSPRSPQESCAEWWWHAVGCETAMPQQPQMPQGRKRNATEPIDPIPEEGSDQIEMGMRSVDSNGAPPWLLPHFRRSSTEPPVLRAGGSRRKQKSQVSELKQGPQHYTVAFQDKLRLPFKTNQEPQHFTIASEDSLPPIFSIGQESEHFMIATEDSLPARSVSGQDNIWNSEESW